MEVAIEAARRAGTIHRKRFWNDKTIAFKGRGNLVTDVDLASERKIVQFLTDEFPGFSILTEESESITTNSRYRWIVDPLDGTRNYASGVPHFCVMIALTRDDEPVLGVTYDPVRRELFRAQLGHGAYLNDKPIKVSSSETLQAALLGFDMGYSDKRAVDALGLIQHLWPGMQSIRVMGSAALGLAYAASGRLDLYFHHQLYPWDMASGLLLVREAGGSVTNRYGTHATIQDDSAIASSLQLTELFLEATEGLAWRKTPEPFP